MASAAEETVPKIRILSIDVGRKNFATYVEDITVEGADGIFALEEKYNALPKIKQRRALGSMTPEMQDILNAVCLTGATIHHAVVDLRADPTCKKLDLPTRAKLFDYLGSLHSLWKSCDIVIIEQQYFSTFTPKGRRGRKTEANVDAIKLGENCYAWFKIFFPAVELRFYGSQFKTQIMGAPGGLTKHQRKKWSITKMKEILELRRETHVLAALRDLKAKKKQKLDDVADCLVMTQAFKFQKMVACW